MFLVLLQYSIIPIFFRMLRELPDDHFDSSVPRLSNLIFGVHQGH
jgi:hypothetical protein